MKLKKLYSSREVAQLTGLTARQLQWWAQSRFFPPTVPSHKTEAGGFTERRYTPIELLELMVLADLRRKGFTVARIRKLLLVLKTRFKTRLYEAIEGGGPVTLYIDGENIYAKNDRGDLFSILDNAAQPLMMMGEDIKLRQLIARERPAKKRAKAPAAREKRGASQA
jgi:DNA-binding transcriptional MerR regulator